MLQQTIMIWAALSFCVCAPATVPPASFNAPRAFPAIWGITSAAVGDFNGDGILDVVVVPDEIENGQLSVYIGNGDGTFALPVQYTLGLGVSAVAIGDFDGDGKLDLAVADNNFYATGGPNVSILLGIGDGTFQAPLTYGVGYFPTFVAVADFNGDGKLDLAVTSTDGDNYISVLLGNGDGSFQPQVTYTVGTSPGTIAVADFNGDGKVDLATANSGSNTVSLLLGKGDGTFQPQISFVVGKGPTSIVAADFNEDGHADLAVAVQNSGVAILLGNGDGTFQQPVIEPGIDAVSLLTVDLNGDGHADLAVSSGNDSAEVLLGTGNGQFKLTGKVSPGGYAMAAGDFNRDGSTDLLVASGPQFSVLLGNGKGEVETVTRYEAGRGPYSVAVGDFNHDGNPDLVIANYGLYPFTYNDVSILLGNGNSTFQPETFYNVGDQPSSVAVADFNRDGNLDVVAANSRGGTLSILLGKGNGTFQKQIVVSIGTNDTEDVAIGDFNGDGIPDIAVSGSLLTILLGKGDGTFSTLVSYSVVSGDSSIVSADFNGDGHADLALISDSVLVLFGIGDGTFGPPVTIAENGGFGISGLAVGDFNGDGIPDLAAGGFAGGVSGSPGEYVGVLLGEGDGKFRRAGTSFVNGAYGIVSGDWNGDGKLDLAVTSRGTAAILLGNGDGTFADPVHFAVGGESQAIASGDFNRDGKPDLAIVAYEPFDVSILTNTTE